MMVSGTTIPSMEKVNFTVNFQKSLSAHLILQILIRSNSTGWYMKANSTKIASKVEGSLSLAMGNILKVVFHKTVLMESAHFIEKMEGFLMVFGDRISYKDF